MSCATGNLDLDMHNAQGIFLEVFFNRADVGTISFRVLKQQIINAIYHLSISIRLSVAETN